MGTYSPPPAAGSRRATSWSRPATTGSRTSRASLPTSTRGSCSCTPASTAVQAQLQGGGVLAVGAGNSGADIALEVCGDHPTWLSGRDKGHIPFRIETPLARLVFPVLWLIASRVLTVRTPLGRKIRPSVVANGAPLIRVKPKDIAAAGIERVPRTVGVRDGLPLLDDGRVLDVSNVIWCTGFRPDFDWIHLPVFSEDGEPVQQRGIVPSEPGLSFLGLDFLYAFTSENVGGVGRDAEHVAKHITSRTSPARTPGVTG